MRHFATFCGWIALAWTVVSLMCWAVYALASLADAAVARRRRRKARARAASLIPQRIDRKAKQVRRRLNARPSPTAIVLEAEDDDTAVEMLLAALRIDGAQR